MTNLETLIASQQVSYEPQWQPAPELPEKPLVIPETEESLGEVCAIAQQNQLSIVPCGNGSKLTWGGLPSQFDFYLSTRHLNQIIDHAVGDLTVTLQAGVTLAQLQAQLKQNNQFLPLDPAYPETATLGGIVATADAGSWRERYGGVRDLLIGISFVRADGEIAKAGGRVVKNVAGYDLMKLFTGSYGTLGIISQLTFRTYPLPPASATVLLTGDADAITNIAQTLRHSKLTPTRADLLSPAITEKLNLGKGLGLIIQWETIIESIEKQIEDISNFAQFNSLTITHYQEENEKSLWDQLKAFTSVAPNNSEITCKIGLLPTAIRDFFSELPPDSYAIIHNKSGLGELVLSADLSVATLKSIRDYCEKNQGFLTLLSAPNAIKTQIEPWGYTGNALTIMKKIKEQFDPNNQFNPNRFVGGI
ncbi:FAD linked oxidase domain protein [Halothece sp. PCC 7418]|uniref:FAD-binding oxidoreductase n=1 Tax=Halothece sp. (strain PCC 7418) TaxID=65093 RepID=UPI0002A05FB6|nr:FAD-binding oxidoreductase [Halothece sp. PCC 7418]AFZ45864.1 FAD linked oxidase domain protein [Halothece sp. PCC 7418]